MCRCRCAWRLTSGVVAGACRSVLNSTSGDVVTPVTRIVDLVTVDLSRYMEELLLPAALTACRSRLVRC